MLPDRLPDGWDKDPQATAAFIRVSAAAMDVLAVAGAATTGLAVGSAINCR